MLITRILSYSNIQKDENNQDITNRATALFYDICSFTAQFNCDFKVV
ncbi:hypothetical protein M0M57_02695 [Flavobacterium azooxidireducens]|uniref:Uncharacterized protein n=1 Tax=Flavobacterium azooxidireducens TaxID=1871076 RepID=A0ABY4KG36_9FLAO|nr:hypothetical protein [Flavobacterium azooxidireducens]UPQ79752.1 hypothetical protein M0M57_02695 [Flavobacterium azooxidireducens]